MVFYVVARELLCSENVAMGFSGVFYVVAMVLLCSCKGVLGGLRMLLWGFYGDLCGC